ncbi:MULTISPECIES: hypothetical protein [unclassified Microcoleus]|uniref:hypothetical protein n=1 Tax=unclassified Microcoleus TaxID=2642155 RepID=UPI002FD64000
MVKVSGVCPGVGGVNQLSFDPLLQASRFARSALRASLLSLLKAEGPKRRITEIIPV